MHPFYLPSYYVCILMLACILLPKMQWRTVLIYLNILIFVFIVVIEIDDAYLDYLYSTFRI
jgi:hypothetical protein